MADLNCQLIVTYNKNNVAFTVGSSGQPSTRTLAGNHRVWMSQIIGTDAEPVNYVDVTPGIIKIRNMDATNYIQLGLTDNAGTLEDIFARILPGDECYLPVEPGTPIYAQADTAPVTIDLLVVDA